MVGKARVQIRNGAVIKAETYTFGRQRVKARVKVTSENPFGIVPFGHSTSFRRFVKENPGVISAAYKLIVKNMERLERGEAVSDLKNRLLIQEGFTGNEQGSEHHLLLRVRVGSRFFFVKLGPAYSELKLTRMQRLHTLLRATNMRYYGFRFRLIVPELIYKEFSATPFYGEDEVLQATELRGALRKRAKRAIEALEKKLPLLNDVQMKNVFYNKRTGELMIFEA